jgi:predicted acylesterase/phospholipase RssA
MKSALVLSGGGAYGAWEVGVMKALCSGQSPSTRGIPLDPSIFTGTSVGSFNASVMTMADGTGSDAVKKLEQFWMYEIADRGGNQGNGVYRIRGNPPSYLDAPSIEKMFEPVLRAATDAAFLGGQWALRATRFILSQGSLSSRVLGLIDICSFICVEPFEASLRRLINAAAIRRSPKVLRIVATDWATGEARIFSNADMTDEYARHIIMASAAIPGIFPSVTIGGDVCVDGGVVMNTPIAYALDAGASDLHVVYVNPDLRMMPLDQCTNTIDILDRVYMTMLATKINSDIEMARNVNCGLETLECAIDGMIPDSEAQKNFIKVAARIHERIQSERPYRQVTIHRYYPAKSLGDTLAMLNFSQAQIRELIAQGFEDACRHDCEKNGCVIPSRVARPETIQVSIAGAGA